jgi:hypothetical protein
MSWLFRLLDLFNPLSWIEKLITIAVGCLIIAGALWWFYDSIGDHFRAPLIAEYKAASDEAERNRLKREFVNKERVTDALTEKLKKLESNAASAKRAADAAIGLRDSIRASEDRAKTSLAACLQHANTLSGLFASIDDFAGSVAVAANGHAADAVACHNAWPK